MECVFRFFWLKSDDLKNKFSGEWMEGFYGRHALRHFFFVFKWPVEKVKQVSREASRVLKLAKAFKVRLQQSNSSWGSEYTCLLGPSRSCDMRSQILVGLAFHEAVFVWDRQLECVIAWFISQNIAVVVVQPFTEAWHLDESNSFILHARRFIEEGEDHKTLHCYLTLANRVVQSFPKITTSECPENGFMPVSSPSVYCKNLRSGKHPSSPEDFKKSAAPTGTFRKPKRCKWHHPWENPRLHQWQSSYMQVNGFITGNPFEKPFCWYQILNCSLFWMTVSKNLKSQMGAAGGDDQLFKPNGVENADLAPTRAFAKYQGSGDLFGRLILSRERFGTRPYPTFLKGKAIKPSFQKVVIL